MRRELACWAEAKTCSSCCGGGLSGIAARHWRNRRHRGSCVRWGCTVRRVVDSVNSVIGDEECFMVERLKRNRELWSRGDSNQATRGVRTRAI